MRFVEIQAGQSINLDQVTYFQEAENEKTHIYCEDGRVYEANMSYKSFRDLINAGANQLTKKLDQISRQLVTPVP